MLYRVKFEIDIEADSPKEAVVECINMISSGEQYCYDAIDLDGNKTTIDFREENIDDN